MIKKLLEKIGFSTKEQAIYLELLKIGQTPVSVIAKNTDINRTTIYDILDALIKKGLVSKCKKGGKTYFNALPPEKLLNYLDREKEENERIIERQKKSVQEVLPELISIQEIYSKNKPKIQLFEGTKGMREAYEDSLTAKELILAYANVEEVHRGLPNFFPEYYKRRTKNKIHIKAIFPKNDKSRERAKMDRDEMRTVKFLPEEKMTFSPEINIYNNKILFVSWTEKMAIIIESKELADFHKLTFELVWNSL